MKIKQIALIILTVLFLFGCDERKPYPFTGGDDSGILSLPPMKDQFSDYFMFGNIMNPGDISSGKVTNSRLTRHYNVLTAENNMKPQFIATSATTYNTATADQMVNAAIASGFKVVGHTLLWHSQNAGWMTPSTVNLNNMKQYISGVVGHFKGRIYSWDVLNEAFPDGGFTNDWRTSIRGNNPWFAAIGADFVYEGFLAARLADPDAILYYNDYNTDQLGKATMIRDMVRDVNIQYKANFPAASHSNNGTRNLIEGIGMQEHHNTGIQASAIRNTLNLFKPLGVKISVSELDVLAQTWGQYSSNSPVTEQGLADQARLYGEYFKLYLEYSDIIERVTFWGVTDNQSWRARGKPLLFDEYGVAKSAYYRVIDALDEYENE
jgi:endo-1,4-beta-xylanase